jgi:iron complex outermembrane receptor protein
VRYTLLYIAFHLTLSINGQLSFEKDTIRINEVIISGKKSAPEFPGYKKVSVDSSVLSNYSHRTVDEILSLKSGIFIKSYGMGGSATPSFRGTGAGHTQVAWNGINIGHPMLGQSDLSLLPAGMIDNIKISFGGASMIQGSGGIGGMINLESKPDWQNKTSAAISQGTGSFGQYSGLIAIKIGTAILHSTTKAFYTFAENNFRYLNSELTSIPVWETRTNNQVKQKGLMQELYYRWQQNIISARIWYQSANRNLPSSMLIPQKGNSEKQSDESFRAMFSLNRDKETSKFNITGAWVMNSLNYTNTLAAIDSRNLSNSITLNTGAETKVFNNSTLSIVLNDELTQINSNNYNNPVNRNTASLSVSANSRITDRLASSFLLREIIDNDRLLIPDFSTAVQFKLFDSKADLLKANISRNSKIPTMNEMFWIPGGNPDLKNEYAYIFEISYDMRRDISSQLSLDYDISMYLNSIKDMIQWRPGAYTYWTADNIQNVNSTGVETEFSLKYKSNRFTSVLDASYTYTKAYDSGTSSIGNQLLYIPEYMANCSLQVIYRNIYATWIADLTGKRYITSDNIKYLPEYLINSISAGYKINLKNNIMDLNICVDNLFNVYYQSIAHFPLPGRSYSLKLLIHFNK